MSDPELIARNFLLEDETVRRVTNSRIYPQRIPPNGKFPAMTYSLISTMAVGSNSDTSTCYWSRVQIGLWAKGYQEVKELRDAVIAHVKNDSRFTWQVNPDTYEDESELYGQPLDFLFNH